MPEFQWIVLVARDEFIQSDGDTIRALLRGYERSARYAVEHLDEWAALYSQWWALEPAPAPAEELLSPPSLTFRV